MSLNIREDGLDHESAYLKPLNLKPTAPTAASTAALITAVATDAGDRTQVFLSST